MKTSPERRLWLLAAGGLALLAAGCGGPVVTPADPEKARAALRSALESWKRGEKPDALQTAVPPVYVVDPDWLAGAALKDFKLLDDGTPMDANLHVRVRLTVRPAGKGESTTDATYIISTAPNVSVSRKVF